MPRLLASLINTCMAFALTVVLLAASASAQEAGFGVATIHEGDGVVLYRTKPFILNVKVDRNEFYDICGAAFQKRLAELYSPAPSKASCNLYSSMSDAEANLHSGLDPYFLRIVWVDWIFVPVNTPTPPDTDKRSADGPTEAEALDNARSSILHNAAVLYKSIKEWGAYTCTKHTASTLYKDAEKTGIYSNSDKISYRCDATATLSSDRNVFPQAATVVGMGATRDAAIEEGKNVINFGRPDRKTDNWRVSVCSQMVREWRCELEYQLLN